VALAGLKPDHRDQRHQPDVTAVPFGGVKEGGLDAKAREIADTSTRRWWASL
jgi:hypothetical protein